MEHKEKSMTTDAFKEYVKTRRALDTEEIHRFMDDMSNEDYRPAQNSSEKIVCYMSAHTSG